MIKAVAKRITKRAKFILPVVVMSALVAVPASANAAGFFEQLFGIAPASQPVPSYDYAPNGGYIPGDVPLSSQSVDQDAVRKSRSASLDDGKPVLQKTTDLMHDKTLRAGDAVMMKHGIEVYQGSESSHHSPRQFTPLDAARVSKNTRNILIAMDETRRDPLEYVSGAGTIKEGRSVSNGPSVSTGYRITDARGQSIRYVGP